MNHQNLVNQLIDTAQAIGGIAESNCHYTDGLARRIEHTGKAINDLTVGELLALDKAYNDFFNQLGNEENALSGEEPNSSLSIDDLLAKQNLEFGLEPMPLETDLLIQRVKDGGFSGDYLACAFISAYRRTAFDYSLGDLIKLDAEGFRLFHQILHIRHIPGWRNDALYTLEQQLKTILQEA